MGFQTPFFTLGGGFLYVIPQCPSYTPKEVIVSLTRFYTGKHRQMIAHLAQARRVTATCQSGENPLQPFRPTTETIGKR